MLVGLAVTQRPVLRGRGPWLAGLIAAVLWVPNLAWDATHGWANLHMAASEASGQGGPLGSLAQLPVLALLLAGILLLALWVKGIRWLWRDPAAAPHRWLLAVPAVAVVIFTASGGKPYYSAPALVGLFAAGAVAVEQSYAGRPLRWRSWPTTLGLSMVTASLIALPFFPVSVASKLRGVDQEVVETYGWPQFTAQVAAATRGLPADTVVFTSNYGEAGAFARFGPALGLHLPIASAHNGYGYWGPPSGSDQLVVAVGEWDSSRPPEVLGQRDRDRAAPARRSHRRGDRQPRRHLPVPGAARVVGPAVAPPAPPRLTAAQGRGGSRATVTKKFLHLADDPHEGAEVNGCQPVGPNRSIRSRSVGIPVAMVRSVAPSGKGEDPQM